MGRKTKAQKEREKKKLINDTHLKTIFGTGDKDGRGSEEEIL